MKPRSSMGVFISVICAMAMMGSPAHSLEANEAAVKAAYLYKFGFFVKWPSGAFLAKDSPINLCVVGKDPFGAALDESVRGQKIGDRTIVVRRLGAVSRESGCHIVYLAEPTGADGVLVALRGSDALTVTDARTGGSEAGIINFVMRDNRVRFDIDDAAAASAGLTISSRLLNLALQVKPRS